MRMRLAWFLVALAVGSAGASPRPGKVVRVERKAAGFTGQPRFCMVQPNDMYGSCMGTRAPEVGERLIAVDRNRVLGTLRVTQVDPNQDGCSQTNNWMIKTATDSGDMSSARGLVLGLSDVTVDSRGGRLLDVDQTPTGHAVGTDQIFALDNNGDGHPDLEFIQFSCDDFGVASTNPTSLCQEVWTASNKTLERVRQDRFRTCY